MARIIAAMSGGVDSAVAAALLHKQGYEVIGITLQLYNSPSNAMVGGVTGGCCTGADIQDAVRAANHIGIKHYVLNYEEAFRKHVIDDFADSYVSGETPVPCVRCNQSVKFTDLMNIAKDLKAEALATGHYAIIKKIKTKQNYISHLYRSFDKDKDQSYFLFATTSEQLARLRFPLGHMEKSQTRKLAEEFNLPIAHKPDSQDLCFVKGGNYRSLLSGLRPSAFIAGDIVTKDDKIIGKHKGIGAYTVGQRRGLSISGNKNPLYVIEIDARNNRIIVGEKKDLRQKGFHIKDVNWLGDGSAKGDYDLDIKIRSSQEPFRARINLSYEKGQVYLYPLAEQDAISCGQACVFYQKDRVLGGGWIKGLIRN